MTATAVRKDRAVSGEARVSAALWRRAWLRATLTLSPPLAWFLVIYLASLLVMLVTAFWSVDPFTNSLVHSWTLANFQQIFTPTYLTIIARTVIMAAVVTVTDAVLALPFAYYMARVATPRGRQALFIAVLLPLWASYLARVYAWIVILQKGGTLSWTLSKLGLGTVNIGYTNIAMWIVFSYIWLPFMIVPIYGALERIPDSLLEASGDLGARNWRTLRSVVLPLALPGVVAGSIFTFSLTLGDFITPILVGGANSSFIGNVIYSNIGTAGNLPFAAALAVVPIVIMIFYLALVPTIIDLGHVSTIAWAELTATMIVVLIAVDFAWVFAAAQARRLLRSARAMRAANRTSATVIAGAAVAIATRLGRRLADQPREARQRRWAAGRRPSHTLPRLWSLIGEPC